MSLGFTETDVNTDLHQNKGKTLKIRYSETKNNYHNKKTC